MYREIAPKVAFHEIFHALRVAGKITKPEWDAITSAIVNSEMMRQMNSKRYKGGRYWHRDGAPTEVMKEEIAADFFAYWGFLNDRVLKPEIDTVFRKVHRLIAEMIQRSRMMFSSSRNQKAAALRNLRGLGYDDIATNYESLELLTKYQMQIESIVNSNPLIRPLFEGILSGEVAAREGGNVPGHLYFDQANDLVPEMSWREMKAQAERETAEARDHFAKRKRFYVETAKRRVKAMTEEAERLDAEPEGRGASFNRMSAWNLRQAAKTAVAEAEELSSEQEAAALQEIRDRLPWAEKAREGMQQARKHREAMNEMVPDFKGDGKITRRKWLERVTKAIPAALLSKEALQARENGESLVTFRNALNSPVAVAKNMSRLTGSDKGFETLASNERLRQRAYDIVHELSPTSTIANEIYSRAQIKQLFQVLRRSSGTAAFVIAHGNSIYWDADARRMRMERLALPAWAMGGGPMVVFNPYYDHQAPRSAYHEVIHLLMTGGFITQEEFDKVADRVVTDEVIDMLELRQRYRGGAFWYKDGSPTERVKEEVMADFFGAWGFLNDRVLSKEMDNLFNKMHSILYKIVQWVRQYRKYNRLKIETRRELNEPGDLEVQREGFEALTKYYLTVERIVNGDPVVKALFEGIVSGEVGSRKPGVEEAVENRRFVRRPDSDPALAPPRQLDGSYRYGEIQEDVADPLTPSGDPDWAYEETRRAHQESFERNKASKSAIEWVKDHWNALLDTFRQVHIQLPNDAHHADLHDWLRQLVAQPPESTVKIERHLNKMMDGLDKRQRDLFGRAVFMNDFHDDYEQGIESIPGFSSLEQFLGEYEKLQELLAEPGNEVIAERLALRKRTTNALSRRLVGAGLISEEALNRPNYITHLVLDYIDEQHGELRVSGYGHRLRKPKYKQRQGTEKLINMNYLEAEAHWMLAAETNLKTAETIGKIDRSKYNKRDTVLALVKERNKVNFEQALLSEWKGAIAKAKRKLNPRQRKSLEAITVNELKDVNRMNQMLRRKRKPGKERVAQIEAGLKNMPPLDDEVLANAPTIAKWLTINQKMGMSMGSLRQHLRNESNVNPDWPAWVHDAIDEFVVSQPGQQGPRESSNAWKLIGFLAAQKDPDPDVEGVDRGIISARIALAAISARRQLVRKTLGDSYMSDGDLRGTLRKLAKEDPQWAEHEAWQPDQGSVMFAIATLSDRAAALVQQHADEIREAIGGDAIGVDQDTFLEIAQSMRTQFVRGGPKRQLVLEKGLASTLNKFRDDTAGHLTARLLKQSVKIWKELALVSPPQAIKYNLRNITGDFDHVFAAYGAAPLQGLFKGLSRLRSGDFEGIEGPAGRAIEMMWNAAKGNPVDPIYDKALAMGVIDSGFSIAEVIDSASEIERVVRWHQRGRVEGFAKKVWGKLHQYTRARENIFRLSVYLHVRERIAEMRELAGDVGKVNPDAANPAMIRKVMGGVGYGGSRAEIVNNLSSWESVAAYVSRETLGDYQNISFAGRKLRGSIFPFYSWWEVNGKFYKNFFQNTVRAARGQDDRTLVEHQAMALTRIAGHSAPVVAAAMAVQAVVPLAVVHVWNNIFRGDEEDELTEESQRRGHITLGKIGDTIVMFPAAGALADVAAWFGMPEAYALYKEWGKGQASVKDILAAMPKGVVNTLVGGANPFLKMPFELFGAQEFYPDALNPRPMYDWKRYMARTFVADKWLEAGSNLSQTITPNALWKGAFWPSRGNANLLASLVFDMRSADYSSYLQLRSMGYDFREAMGHESGAPRHVSEKFLAMRNLSLSMKYGDRNAEARFRKVAEIQGLTREEEVRMRYRAHPIGMLTKAQRSLFYRSLTPRELRRYEKAQRWWYSTFIETLR